MVERDLPWRTAIFDPAVDQGTVGGEFGVRNDRRIRHTSEPKPELRRG